MNVPEAVHDRVAEKLEASGLWRRAASRWLEMMFKHGYTAAQLEWLRQRRVYCHRQLIGPVSTGKQGTTSGSKTATTTMTKMGLSHPRQTAFGIVITPKSK